MVASDLVSDPVKECFPTHCASHTWNAAVN